MNIYLLGKENLCDRLHEDHSAGMALLDLMERMGGFVTLAGHHFVFSKEIKSTSLIPVESPLPSTYAYTLKVKSRAALRVTQALRGWLDLEAELKETFELHEDDTVMYMSKLNNQVFVKADKPLPHLEVVDDEEFMRSLRSADFEAEILSVLDSLHSEYSKQVGFDALLTATRIKSLLSNLEMNGCYIPERFWGFSTRH